MKREVTVIPPTIQMHTHTAISSNKKRRACGYARVSTDSEEQLSSYSAQMEYYKKYISENEKWEFVGLYSDEGRSGTNIKGRPGFQKMVRDALNGNIDLIITKSISRFARNTVDSINTVRTLKDKGVEVFFEKDGLWTFDPSAELVITIISSLAQNESMNLSQNVSWGRRVKFSEGKVSMPYKRFLGYEKGENGEPVINEEQAKIVRKIYRLFVEGMMPVSIAKALTKEGIPTPGGKTKWQNSVVKSILTNEKYKGDALLQKSFCTNYLTKKMKINEGEVPQYYVTDSHPAIIQPELFDYVQDELKSRIEKGFRGTGSPFTSKLVCSDCGRYFGRKLWHSTSKYRAMVWQCNYKFKNEKVCTTSHFKEYDIKSAFIDVFNNTLKSKDEIINNYQQIISTITDCWQLEQKVAEIDNECLIIQNILEKFIKDNASTVINQNEYNAKYDEMVEKYDNLNNERTRLSDEIASRKSKRVTIDKYVKTLKAQKALLTEFDEQLWLTIVDKVIVYSKRQIIFHFKDGTEIPYSFN